MHADEFLDLVADQVLDDVHTGDLTALFEILDKIPRDALIGYLSETRLQKALTRGIVTQDKASAKELENLF